MLLSYFIITLSVDSKMSSEEVVSPAANEATMSKIDLSKPRYPQDTYMGRVKHFFALTNPLNLRANDADLDRAKKIVDDFKKSRKMPAGYNEDKLWKEKYLFDSAFHPDTGEKLTAPGRMSAQAPMNTFITGGMLACYKSNVLTILWQWFNQTFNAVVNYSNRSGSAAIPTSSLLVSYVAACSGAMGTAYYLNGLTKSMKPVMARFIPFAAVCGANFVNIPLMRMNEIKCGTPVFNANNVKIGDSKSAAKYGIFLVCISRVAMAVPGMIITPLIIEYYEKRGVFCRAPWKLMPVQVGLVAIGVTIATPLGCALFPQYCPYPVDSLEPDLKNKMKSSYPKEKEVFFNKGL